MDTVFVILTTINNFLGVKDRTVLGPTLFLKFSSAPFYTASAKATTLHFISATSTETKVTLYDKTQNAVSIRTFTFGQDTKALTYFEGSSLFVVNGMSPSQMVVFEDSSSTIVDGPFGVAGMAAI